MANLHSQNADYCQSIADLEPIAQSGLLTGPPV
jgi:hypothetical protein